MNKKMSHRTIFKHPHLHKNMTLPYCSNLIIVCWPCTSRKHGIACKTSWHTRNQLNWIVDMVERSWVAWYSWQMHCSFSSNKILSNCLDIQKTQKTLNQKHSINKASRIHSIQEVLWIFKNEKTFEQRKLLTFRLLRNWIVEYMSYWLDRSRMNASRLGLLKNLVSTPPPPIGAQCKCSSRLLSPQKLLLLGAWNAGMGRNRCVCLGRLEKGLWDPINSPAWQDGHNLYSSWTVAGLVAS